MSFMYFEGTKDYLAATPALITTFEASGSITAGRLVSFNTNADQRVSLPGASTASGSANVAGLAVATVSNGDPCPVLVWGYAKNIAATGTFTVGNPIVSSGSGYVATSGSPGHATGSGQVGLTGTARWCGRYISGSTTSAIAFINCMGP